MTTPNSREDAEALIDRFSKLLPIMRGAGMISDDDIFGILDLARLGLRVKWPAGEGDRWTKTMVDERDTVIADNAWNAAIDASIAYVKEIVGDQATAKLNAFEVYAALNTLRKEPS